MPKFRFVEQDSDFPYVCAVRIVEGPVAEVLFHPDYGSVVGRAEKVVTNPLVLALLKSQIGDSLEGKPN